MVMKFYSKNISLLTVSFIFFCFVSCQHGSKDKFSTFFNDLSGRIEKERLDTFKSSQIDSIGKTVDLVSEDVREAFKNLDPKSDLRMYMDTTVTNILFSRVDYLTVAFHLYCNNIEIEHEVVLTELIKMTEYKWQKEHETSRIEERRILDFNNLAFQIDDTINICLPVCENKAFYYGGVLPDSLYFSEGTDSLMLSGIILNKSYGYYLGEIDSLNLRFSIRILQIGDDIQILGKRRALNDTLDLSVFKYMRIIERGLYSE